MGYATAWIAPNPISSYLIAQGKFTRWTSVAHHVLHGGYDALVPPGQRFHSKTFAQRGRRWLDWPDWLYPEAWKYEHNTLHHYRLGEEADPDLVERYAEWIRQLNSPVILKLLLIGYFMCTWKFTYYMGKVLQASDGKVKPSSRLLQAAPCVLIHFGFIPLLFLPSGVWALSSVLINTLLAECITNIHSFITIVTNHAGDDLYRFEGKPAGLEEFQWRQILGSTNYQTGGFLNDALHGYLNYQIEHHLWPDKSMMQYRWLQPHVKALCADYQVPYIQESVWIRLRKTLSIMLGRSDMKTGWSN